MNFYSEEKLKEKVIESRLYINRNLNAYVDDIPQKFVDAWFVDDPVAFFKNFEQNETAIQFTIFMYAYGKVFFPGTSYRYDVDLNEVYPTFFIFNLLLATRKIQDTTDIEFTRVKLFDFKNYDKLDLTAFFPNNSPYLKPFIDAIK